MADLITNLLTYEDYLLKTSQSHEDIPLEKLSLLSLQEVVDHKLNCIGITDITTLPINATSVLQNWAIRYVSLKVDSLLTSNAEDTYTTKISDGFVEEHFAKHGKANLDSINNDLEYLWNLFVSLSGVADTSLTTSGIGVAVRPRSSVCSTSQNST